MRTHRNPRQRLSKHQIRHNPDAPTLVHSRKACTMADLDAIRFEVSRADVMADVAREHFDRTDDRQARGHRAMSSDVAGASLWWRRVATVAGLIVLVDLVGRVLGSCGGAR